MKNLKPYSDFGFLSITDVNIDRSPTDIITCLYSKDTFNKLHLFKLLFKLKRVKLPPSLNNQKTKGTSFTFLDKSENRILLGLSGKFWNWNPNLLVQNKNEFENFNEPGYTQVVWSFTAKELKTGTSQLFLTLFLKHTDEYAEKQFNSYWKIGKYISFIARQLLLIEIKIMLK